MTPFLMSSYRYRRTLESLGKFYSLISIPQVRGDLEYFYQLTSTTQVIIEDHDLLYALFSGGDL